MSASLSLGLVGQQDSSEKPGPGSAPNRARGTTLFYTGSSCTFLFSICCVSSNDMPRLGIHSPYVVYYSSPLHVSHFLVFKKDRTFEHRELSRRSSGGIET